MRTSEIKAAMARQWKQPEYALFFEVRDGAGFDTKRSADAVIMSLWPSRGLRLTGVEIKVSRSDWHREKTNPAKADSIARFCDEWVLLTGPNVVNDVDEVPPLWGWTVFDGKSFKVMRKSGQQPAEPPTRSFLAALLRRADEAEAALRNEEVEKRIADQRKALEESFQKRIEREVASRSSRATDLLKTVEQFEAASGISIRDTWRSGSEVGRVVKAVLESGAASTYAGLLGQAKQLEDAAANIRKAFADLNLAPESVDTDEILRSAMRRTA
ncbi:hypothetical protein OSH11_13815 [Kaistia dalseonensis]|uniref:Uncharacterized protein n=1 Tax=Kaistia dalseonensis TaxID=410840 RepID=A0ABU0H8P8_9HYPH|nr:hypothetical protein [Kaistia dalseonensis]MCX5495786.1 hypothetical protein [Kaistia dalseonensis]MDQ0438387.1 hypothetical protein [Kaistia dalseonensis]